MEGGRQAARPSSRRPGRRFVPIAMTSLATVIGLIPTALGLEHGTESNQPLALAVVGGLTSSTILSLFLVPVMFLLFAKEPVRNRKESTHESPLPDPPAFPGGGAGLGRGGPAPLRLTHRQALQLGAANLPPGPHRPRDPRTDPPVPGGRTGRLRLAALGQRLQRQAGIRGSQPAVQRPVQPLPDQPQYRPRRPAQPTSGSPSSTPSAERSTSTSIRATTPSSTR